MPKYDPNSLHSKCGGQGLDTRAGHYQLVHYHKEWSSGSHIHSANTYGTEYLHIQKKNKSLNVGEVPVRLGNHPGYRGYCWPDSSSMTFQSWTRMLNPVLYSSDGESTVNQEAMASSS